MKIEYRLIDDLKTERPDIAPSLPAYLRLVPVLFYATVLGSTLLSFFFLALLRNAAASEKHWKAEITQHKQALADMQIERDFVEQQARRASDIAAWVEGARGLQPLVVAIIRSMEPSSSIAKLELARDPAIPTQINLTLQLNAQGTRQLDATLGKITALNFRAYNPSQTQSRGEIDYTATLIHQSPRASTSTPPPIPHP